MELMSARRNAGWAASMRKPGDSTGGCSAGKPVGKSPSVGASVNQTTATTVLTIRVAR